MTSVAAADPSTTTTRAVPFDPAQWPVLVGYGALFASVCVAGLAVGLVVEWLWRRRR